MSHALISVTADLFYPINQLDQWDSKNTAAEFWIAH